MEADTKKSVRIELKKIRKGSLKTQFRIATGIILFLFCLGGTLLVYNHQRNQLSATVYKDTEIYISTVDAVRTYVKDILRPEMYAILPPDHFIPEAMSTSFVGREVMKRLHNRFPEFIYKRASSNPINPLNRADAFESEMIQWFHRHPDSREWFGMIQKKGRDYYARLRRITVEKECLHCHGDPQRAPLALVQRYGSDGGFGYQVGEVVAADAVYIPVDVAYLGIKKQAWMTFFIGALALLTLIVLFYTLFNHTVIAELKGMLTTFKDLIPRKPGEGQNTAASQLVRADEIGQLTEAFKEVAADLKKTHDGLSRSELKYRRLFEASQDAIFIWEENRKIVDLNQAGVEMFSLKSRSEALEMESIEQLFWDIRDCRWLLTTLKEKGAVKDHEVSMVDRCGKRLEIAITANVRNREGNGPDGFEGVMRDITEKKRLEQYLAQTEKMVSIGQLAAGVAHEINNPLGVITCYSNLVAKSLETNCQARADLDVIQKHTENCKKIVEALLSFARVTETRRIKTDIHTGINEVLAVLEKQMIQDKIVLSKHFATDLPPAVIDASKMKQVYMNLIMNARQATAEGGKILLTTRFDTKSKMIQIGVADTGTGIGPETLERIFDPFFTTKKTGQGTGLGLSVSYGIAKDHGGDILVESTPGKGSVFTIVLPVE